MADTARNDHTGDLIQSVPTKKYRENQDFWDALARKKAELEKEQDDEENSPQRAQPRGNFCR